MRAGTTGRTLRDARGVSFRFDAGAVCLDFAHTGGEGRYAVFETLHEPADLGEWLAQPPLAAILTVPVSTPELAAAKALRHLGRGPRPGGAPPAPRWSGSNHQPIRDRGPADP